jgi:parallel beta-helix repeat protein
MSSIPAVPRDTNTFYYDRNTLYVGGSGPGNYSTIQQAINNATAGDSVYVYNDSSPYYETITIDTTLQLIGEHKKTTIIDGSNSGDVVYITADGVGITGFTLQNCGGTWSRSAILVHAQDTMIVNNIIINARNGIFLEDASYNTIDANKIIRNGYHGIRVEHSIHNVIKENEIIENEANGIYLWSTSDNHIFSNTIADNLFNGIFIGDFCTNNILSHNNLIRNELGNAYDSWEENIWNYTYPVGGNYWDDYDGEDNNDDGIGDTSYYIKGEGHAEDSFPLMDLFSVDPLTFDVHMKGGIGFAIQITNIGEKDRYFLPWHLVLEGGFLLSKRELHGFDDFLVDEEFLIKHSLFGIGFVTIHFELNYTRWQENVFVLGPFAILL